MEAALLFLEENRNHVGFTEHLGIHYSIFSRNPAPPHLGLLSLLNSEAGEINGLPRPGDW